MHRRSPTRQVEAGCLSLAEASLIVLDEADKLLKDAAMSADLARPHSPFFTPSSLLRARSRSRRALPPLLWMTCPHVASGVGVHISQEAIRETLPNKRQTLLLSATMPVRRRSPAPATGGRCDPRAPGRSPPVSSLARARAPAESARRRRARLAAPGARARGRGRRRGDGAAAGQGARRRPLRGRGRRPEARGQFPTVFLLLPTLGWRSAGFIIIWRSQQC